ncbi:MAG TPA: DUF3300 domain-containing protein [Candidatus Acidoferrum sp.]
MITKLPRNKFRKRIGQSLVAILCALSLAPGDSAVYAEPMTLKNERVDQGAPTIPNGQLDSLVAPVALYPDPLLTQVLVASTYPLEIIQLQQWIQKNSDLTGDALTNAVEKQDWDPSIQSMAIFPDLVKRLADDIKWTTDLGNAFLAQQSDVMDAVQRMRMKAKDAGNLKSSEQMKVETEVVETKTVVVIQPANPQIVYVPTYNPVVVYGPPVYLYPYPPIYYPPPSYYPAGVFFAFGVGIAVGSYYRGGWGYNCGWGRRTTININVNNRYVSHYNRTNINVNRNINNVNVHRNGASTWQHNSKHRGGTPYSNQQVAKQYGGTARGDSMSTRQASARQQQGANRPASNGNSSKVATSASNRIGSNAGSRPNNTVANGANRPSSGAGTSASNRGANRSSSGSGNTIGNRQVPSSDTSKNTSVFGGASNKASAQASSARGASSLGSSRSGGTRSPAAGRARATRKS